MKSTTQNHSMSICLGKRAISKFILLTFAFVPQFMNPVNVINY